MHVVVTGASSGIGEAVARAFARRGAALTLIARREPELRRVASATGARTHVAALDLEDLDALEPAVRDARQALGPIDVLVNNAGVEVIGRFDHVSSDEGERLLKVNLFAPLRLTRLCLPEMAARRTGSIVDVSSVAAFTTPSYYRYYGASKAGMAAASEALRAEARRAGVHVVTVYPGPIRTAMGERALGRLGSPSTRGLVWGEADVLGEKIVHAHEARQARVVYPGIYRAMRWFPGLSRWVLDTFMPQPEASVDERS